MSDKISFYRETGREGIFYDCDACDDCCICRLFCLAHLMIKALQGFGVDLDQHSHCRKKGILIIMDKNQIFITSGTEYKRMTKELLEKADLQSHIGDRKKRSGSSRIWFLLQRLPGVQRLIRKWLQELSSI